MTADWIIKHVALWGVLILFALVMLILHNQQQAKQRAIDIRCSTSYAAQTQTLSQLADRPDFFQQIAESIWHVSNCQQKAPAR
jgi:hypothetical protein